MSLPWLEPGSAISFPPLTAALDYPNGLLAAGGDLSPERLLFAYRNGIFPWFEEGQPILWWAPDPRLVLWVDRMHVSHSLAKLIRQHAFQLTMDQAFPQVMQLCAGDRRRGPGTWISAEMISAYSRLHQMGYAHSVEVWQDGELAGGLYGVAIGRMFFGESMFSRESNTSKLALFYLLQQLKRWEFPIIYCQVRRDHLVSLGAEEIDRAAFIKLVQQQCALPAPPASWCFDSDLIDGSYEFKFQSN